MAENENEKNDAPKDITPNPMKEAEKKNAAPSAEVPSDAPPSTDAPAEDEPKDVKGALKATFIDSLTMNRMLQFILIAAGLFGLFLGFKGQEFMPVPAAAGMLAFVLAALFDIYIGKKFDKEEGVGTVSKIALASVFAALMITYIVEIFKKLKFDLPLNKLILMLAVVVVGIVAIIQAILYIRKNKEKVVADIQMLIAFILAFFAGIVFYLYFAIASYVLALASLVLVMMSITKDPLKDDGRLNARLTVITSIVIIFLLILTYAATIFINKPIAVTVYGEISPPYRTKPVNLTWSGDSWSFAYNLFDNKKKEGSVNILNSLSLGINTLPPKKNQEAAESDFSFKLPISRSEERRVGKEC